MVVINLDELRRTIKLLDGEQKDKLITFIEMCEVYGEVDTLDVEMRKSIYTFNRAKSPLVKESFHSPKCIKWNAKLDKLLISTLVDKGETYGAFMKSCGIDGVTEGAVRNRIYKLGWRRPGTEWVKSK